MDNKLYDLSQLHDMLGEGTPDSREILELFLDLTPETQAAMESAFKTQDYEKLGNLAHKMKSSTRLLGMEKISHALQELETISIKSQDTQQLSELMSQLQSLLPAVTEQLKANELPGA